MPDRKNTTASENKTPKVSNTISDKNTKRKRSIVDIYNSFIRNIESIEVFFTKLSPVAENEDEEMKKRAITHIESCFIEVLGEEIYSTKLKDLFNQENSDKISKHKKASPGKDIELTKEQSEILLGKLFRKPLAIHTKNSELIANSSFIMLNNYFEYLFADLLTYNFINNDVLSKKQVSINIADIKKFSTIDELYNDIIYKEVETMLLESSFDTIKEYFTKQNIHLENGIVDWSIITEIRERRHIIIHNNSVVNNKYILRSNNPYKLKIGDEVKINIDYFKHSVDELKLAGLILIFNCWGKWDKANIDDAIEQMLSIVYDACDKKDYIFALKVCEYVNNRVTAKNRKQAAELYRIRINECIALKRLGKTVELSEKLAFFDTIVLTPIFKIAIYILKDNSSKIIPLINKAKIVDEFEIDDYLEWPLFEEVRSNQSLNEKIIQILTSK